MKRRVLSPGGSVTFLRSLTSPSPTLYTVISTDVRSPSVEVSRAGAPTGAARAPCQGTRAPPRRIAAAKATTIRLRSIRHLPVPEKFLSFPPVPVGQALTGNGPGPGGHGSPRNGRFRRRDPVRK